MTKDGIFPVDNCTVRLNEGPGIRERAGKGWNVRSPACRPEVSQSWLRIPPGSCFCQGHTYLMLCSFLVTIIGKSTSKYFLGRRSSSWEKKQRVIFIQGFPSGSVVKNLPANAGDAGLIPGSGRSPGEGNGKPLLYSCLGNPMDRRAWWATVHGHNFVTEHTCNFYTIITHTFTDHFHVPSPKALRTMGVLKDLKSG